MMRYPHEIDMKIKIIVAPQTNPDPYWKPLQPLGVAVITAHLKKKGYHVDQDDLDIRTLDSNRNPKAPFQRINLEPFRNHEKVKAYLLEDKPYPYLEKMVKRLLSWTNYTGYDVVAISMATRAHQLMTAVCMAKKIKEETGATVILGGRRIYPELLRDFPFLDYGILMDHGENMEKLLRLMEGDSIKAEDIPNLMYRKGKDVRIGPPWEMDPSSTSYPDYSQIPIQLYKYKPYKDLDDTFPKKEIHILPYHIIEGCVGKCAFCSSRPEKLRIKPLDKVDKEIGLLKKEFKTNNFMFTSNEINVGYPFMDKFTDMLIPHNILWTDSARLDVFDEKLMKKVADSGCIHLTYGLESGSQRLLDSLNKGVDLKKASKILRWGYKYGIWSHINLIAGLPFETDDDIQQTIDFINKHAEFMTTVTINKYFVAYNSEIEQFPEKFGLRLRKENQIRFSNVILESSVFDEINGLTWEEKREKQNKTVELIDKSYIKRARMVVPIPTLFYLYSVYGRDIKKIERIVDKFNLKKPYGRYG